FLDKIGKQASARRGVDQGLKTMCEQVRHAAGAAIFDVVMDWMGVAARGLERGEHRRSLGPARDHETFAEHEILEPALFAHHAVLCGVEVGHVGFLPFLFDVIYRYRSGRAATIGSIRRARAIARSASSR